MKALIDTNVIIDVLQQREPWFKEGSAIFLAIAGRQVAGHITARQVLDLHFFSRKQFRGQNDVDARAREVIAKLLGLFEVIDTLAVDCRTAMGIDNNDYEDAVMIASAQRSGMDCIVTRDPDHFRASPIAVYSPGSFIQHCLSKDSGL